jgi:hypothetical protein
MHPKEYCETTTVHGFQYWVSAPGHLEKLFWVIVVITGFSCAGSIISIAVQDWMENPGITGVDTYSKAKQPMCYQYCTFISDKKKS